MGKKCQKGSRRPGLFSQNPLSNYGATLDQHGFLKSFFWSAWEKSNGVGEPWLGTYTQTLHETGIFTYTLILYTIDYHRIFSQIWVKRPIPLSLWDNFQGCGNISKAMQILHFVVFQGATFLEGKLGQYVFQRPQLTVFHGNRTADSQEVMRVPIIVTVIFGPIFSVYPPPRMPVTNEGLGWDSLLKM